ncbi:MAG: hypothetical protein PVH19_04875 [Planctomycetia bacterium]|jgi:hypothetical protein
MVNPISNSLPLDITYRRNQNSSTIDVRNVSPNDLAAYATKLQQEGKVSLKTILPFIPIDTSQMSEAYGSEVSVKYYSDLWKNPNNSRDMLKEYKNVASQMATDNTDIKSQNVIKEAIQFLENLANDTSFADILREKAE